MCQDQIHALETEKGKNHQREYWSALGRFVDMFSRAEMAVIAALWHYAKTSQKVSRIIFSGHNIDTSMTTIKRLAEANNAPLEKQTEIKYLLDHLGEIKSARNDILHFGAMNIAEGNAAVTNAIKAVAVNRIIHFPASPRILRDMTSDLQKIAVHLLLYHVGSPEPSPETIDIFTDLLRDTWKYKHQPQPLKSNMAGEKSQPPHKRAPKQTRQPQS